MVTMTRDIKILVALAALVALFTMANLGLTLRTGALAMASIYDDCTYLLDGYRRLALEGVDSVLGGLISFYQTPPHAPFSTAMAMVGYYLSGGSDIGPYALNAVILYLYAYSIFSIARSRLAISPALLWTAALMFLPAAGTIITEFRPDATAALLFGSSAYLLIFFPYERGTRVSACALGLIAGIAITIKPSAIIIVVPMLGGAFLLGMLKNLSRPSFTNAFIALISGLAVLVPFALIWGSHIVDYLTQVFITNADIWVTSGGTFFHWTYNSVGAAGSLALSWFFFLGAALIAADVLSFRREKAGGNYEAFAYYGWVAIIYAGIAANPQKSPFQGNFFYFPFVIAMTIAFSRVCARFGFGWKQALSIFVVVSFVSTPAMTYQDARLRPGSLAALDQISAEINRLKCGHPVVVSTIGPYPIPPETIALHMLKQGTEISPTPLFFARDLQVALAQVQSSDIVIFPNSRGRTEAEEQRLPGIFLYDEIVSVLESDARWTRVAIEGTDPSFIFRNNERCQVNS